MDLKITDYRKKIKEIHINFVKFFLPNLVFTLIICKMKLLVLMNYIMFLEVLHVSTKKYSACFELSFVAKNDAQLYILLKKNHFSPSRNANGPFLGKNLDM